jgi:hypothetical protein
MNNVVVRICLLALALVSLSCHYRLYRATDRQGRTHRVRGYRSYKREHRYFDGEVIRYKYQQHDYPADARCVSRTDTSIDCDTVKIYVLKDSWAYADAFTRGIIPPAEIGRAYGKLSELPGVELVPGKPGPDTAAKSLIVYDFHRLDYIHSRRFYRFFQFHVYPYWYYVELTNPAGRRRMTFHEFLNGSHLTWIYRSKVTDQ